MKNASNLYKEIIELKKINKSQAEMIKKAGTELGLAKQKIRRLEKQHEDYVRDEEERIANIVAKAVNETKEQLAKEYNEIIDGLKKEITRLEARLNTDSTNSGTPTSKNRIDAKIPNTREKKRW